MTHRSNAPRRTASRLALRVAGAAISAGCALMAWSSLAEENATAAAAAPAKSIFTDGEIRLILSHGPWPAPAPADPTNRVSGKREAIELGTHLFFDQRLSGSGTLSCASCHVPERNWTDNRRRGAGMAELERNTPTLSNLAAGRWYGWDGAADSLWSQSLRPILDSRELASSPRQIAQLIRGDDQLSCRYRKAFGAQPATDDEAVFVNVGKALAAFQETLTSGRTSFDHFRDALSRGAPPASWRYSETAQRGLKLFIGKAGCTNCHAGPNFTNGEFFNTGLTKNTSDPGRHAGIQRLAKSHPNLLGSFNDDSTGISAARTRALSSAKENFGEVKVPSLRNLMLTTPYGRDGSIDTLADVVKHYVTIDPLRLHAKDGKPATPLNLSAREQSDLVVFLESLSTFSNPWRPEEDGPCR